MGVFPGKAVKGTYGAVQSNGCMGIGIRSGQMDQTGKPGPGAGQKDVDGARLCGVSHDVFSLPVCVHSGYRMDSKRQ